MLPRHHDVQQPVDRNLQRQHSTSNVDRKSQRQLKAAPNNKHLLVHLVFTIMSDVFNSMSLAGELTLQLSPG